MRLILNSKPLRMIVLAVCLVYATGSHPFAAQVAPEPLREQLLNGLRVLMWPRPTDPDVLIKLRIHSGAAFDVSGKAGEMALLGDLLFPDPATREYFTDEMGGRLDVDTNYDSITVTMQGRPSEFDRMVEILRNAILTTQLTPENVTRIREGRMKIAKETAVSSAIVADRAIAARLFGEFPYGRPQHGSAESLARVERADLMLARERFLNPNNATVAVAGNFQRKDAIRTLRQLLGSWRKSEHVVPSTFRQPDQPDLRTLLINAPADQNAEIRLAVRGLSRSDQDLAAANVLAIVARKRWEKLVPELTRTPTFARHEAHFLPGMFVMGASVHNSIASNALETGRSVLNSLVDKAVSPDDLQAVKTELVGTINQGLSKPDGIAQAWLDLDTFGLQPINEQIMSLNKLSPTDLQRVAARLVRNTAITSVLVGNSDQLKAALGSSTKVELIGVIEDSQPDNSKTKPPAKPSPTTKPD